MKCGREQDLKRERDAVVIESENEKNGANKRKVPKKEMWDIIEELAKIKAVTNYVKASISESRWEKKWHGFISRVWREETPRWEWDAKELVYTTTVPRTCQEHIGETKVGILKRWRGHLGRAMAGGKHGISRMLKKLNPFKAVITPL